jgi:hypothetical protein
MIYICSYLFLYYIRCGGTQCAYTFFILKSLWIILWRAAQSVPVPCCSSSTVMCLSTMMKSNMIYSVVSVRDVVGQPNICLSVQFPCHCWSSVPSLTQCRTTWSVSAPDSCLPFCDFCSWALITRLHNEAAGFYRHVCLVPSGGVMVC